MNPETKIPNPAAVPAPEMGVPITPPTTEQANVDPSRLARIGEIAYGVGLVAGGVVLGEKATDMHRSLQVPAANIGNALIDHGANKILAGVAGNKVI